MLAEECKLSALGVEHQVQTGTASMLWTGRLCRPAHTARREPSQKVNTLCKTHKPCMAAELVSGYNAQAAYYPATGRQVYTCRITEM